MNIIDKNYGVRCDNCYTVDMERNKIRDKNRVNEKGRYLTEINR